MKRLLTLLFLLASCVQAMAQSSATPVIPGTTHTTSPYFTQYSSTNKLPIAVYDAGNNAGYCYTSNGSSIAATFQVCPGGGGGGGSPGGATDSVQYNAGGGNFGGELLMSAQILFGQTAAPPLPETVSGDVTFTNLGAATVGSIGGEAVTLGGAFTMSGAHTFTGTVTGNTSVTFPTSGTLSTTTGTVTAVSIANANGFSGSSSGGATPVLTIVAGAITPSSVNGVTISNSNTPTWTIGSANGVPAVTASSPLIITSATGNITCPTCNTSSANVNSVSGDGTLISNSTSTGAVTLTLANATAKSLWGNTSSSPGAPNYQTSPVVSGSMTADTLVSTVSTGTSPLTVSSTTNVANLNASTLTGNAVGTSGATIPLLNGANTWSGVQTYTNSDLALLGSSTGKTTFTSGNAGASNYTLTIPAATDTIAELGQQQIYTANQTVQAFSLTASSTTFTPTMANGNDFQITLLTSSCSCSIANPTGTITPGTVIGLDIRQPASGGPATITTWGSYYIWPGGSSPTQTATANYIDEYTCRAWDSTHLNCTSVSNFAH